jgi:hypothetical protein
MDDILEKLKGGDLRSIGRANEVVNDVLRDPSLFGSLFQGLFDDDPIVRMRSADAVEKITTDRPELLQPYKATLIEQVAAVEQQEVRWHVAQMIPRLELSQQELARVTEILISYLDDKSNIVKTFSMQALADLAEQHPSLLPQAVEVIERLTRTGSPAMQSRGRKLLPKLRSHRV